METLEPIVSSKTADLAGQITERYGFVRGLRAFFHATWTSLVVFTPTLLASRHWQLHFFRASNQDQGHSTPTGTGCTMQSISLKSLQFYGVVYFIGSFLDMDHQSVMLHSSRMHTLDNIDKDGFQNEG